MKRIAWLWLGLGLAAVGWAAARWLGQRPRSVLPHAWQSGLVERHGPEEARRLAACVEERYRELMASHLMPSSAAMRAEVRKNILPGLALYQVLLAHHAGDRALALAEMEPLFEAWTKEMYEGLMGAFHRLPRPFLFFRLGLKMRMQGYPNEAWSTRWIEDSPRRVALDNYSCFYLDALRLHGAAELTPLYCRIDHWMAELLPASIRFSRTQTQAEGAAFCNFRYERVV